MTFEHTYETAVECIREFSRAGFKIPVGPGAPDSVFGVLNWQRAEAARAFDSRDRARSWSSEHRARDIHQTQNPRGEADLAKDERYDAESLRRIRAMLQRFIESEGASNPDTKFARQMLSVIEGYLASDSDAGWMRRSVDRSLQYGRANMLSDRRRAGDTDSQSDASLTMRALAPPPGRSDVGDWLARNIARTYAS